jgi:hypothetical protein
VLFGEAKKNMKELGCFVIRGSYVVVDRTERERRGTGRKSVAKYRSGIYKNKGHAKQYPGALVKHTKK